MPSSENAQTLQLAAAVAAAGFVSAEAHQALVLAAFVGPASIGSPVSQSIIATATIARTVPQNQQAVALVAYTTGIRSDPTTRAWVFTQDAHTFYVLTLGDTETAVFDASTGGWSQWITEGFPIWNAQHGGMWESTAVAASFQEPLILAVDPNVELDEGFRPIRREATAIVTVRDRDALPVGLLDVAASTEDQQTIPATMTLSFSDDGGRTFFEFDVIEFDPDDGARTFSYRSLGTMFAPGRVFSISDFGGPVRISGATIEISGRDNG